ncbi:MAG TPA: rhamnogalacturonan acetylesterase [Tepidisphaeraceae bacterium]|nr:rhamnogalacturonan acetylesterase [Tepidisphaeraceae bacterium]
MKRSFTACLILLALLPWPATAAAQPAPTIKPDLPTLWIIGDSTVRNSTKGQRGWGDPIAEFFDRSRINVVTKARGGRSSRTYITEGLWDEVLAQLKPGDFVMIQFGHNDGGPLDDTHRARGSIRGIGDESREIFNPIMKKQEVVRTFGWYMSKYIHDTRAKGATPIVLSYVPRAPRPNAATQPAATGPTSYALWAQQVAERENAPFIDLHGIVSRHYAMMAPEVVKKQYFAPDNTHTNEAGALRNAAAVVEGVRALNDVDLAKYLLARPQGGGSSDSSHGGGGGSSEQTFDFPPGQTPPTFSVPLPEGNYDVTITFGDEKRATSNTVKAESRQLMIERVETKPGEFATRTFTVNVRTPQLPGGERVRLKDREKPSLRWDNQLSLELNGKQPGVKSIRITPRSDAITVFLAGDSTVTDQAEEPWAGWGQMLPRFFKPGVAVANHAESGESLRSFRGEKRLEKILSQMKAGDYLFIQFGHNDMKETGEGVGPFTTFKRDLEDFVAQGRSKGATVVLVTPMHRRRFGADGTIQNSHGDYPEAVRQVAQEQNVPLIDLQVLSKQLYEALGAEESKKAFVHYPANTFPGQDKALKDDTHFNNYGAYQLARCIVEGIRAAKLPLAEHLVEDVNSFDPGKPDAAATFDLAASPPRPTTTPAGS